MKERDDSGGGRRRRGKALSKRDLAMRVSGILTQYTQQQVLEVLQTALGCIADALVSGRHVEFRDFGVLEVVIRKARIGRNPNRPEHAVTIPARRVVKFKAGKLLKGRLSSEARKAGNAR
ncbi:MAG: integration host factor subunit beta [Kiritimatiellae bacterium]|nr:integration host factor subunit beta [Kiritimatiellia bacterium]